MRNEPQEALFSGWLPATHRITSSRLSKLTVLHTTLVDHARTPVVVQFQGGMVEWQGCYPARETFIMTTRLYIDESGNHGYGDLVSSGGRYLGLTGLIIDSDQYRLTFHPGLETLKRNAIPHDPDYPVILHRRDIIDRKVAFKVLQSPTMRQEFNNQLIEFIEKQDYLIITAVEAGLPHHHGSGSRTTSSSRH